MASRSVVAACLLTALLGGLPAATAIALEAPTGILALPASDDDQVPCGGAAVLIGADGLALTLDEALPGIHASEDPAHAAAATTVTVILAGGRRRQAEILKRGSATTAVLLRVRDLPADAAAPLALADSGALRLGDSVWTAGNSFGSLEQDGVAAISRGVASGLYTIPADSPPVRGRGGRVLSAYRGAVIETDAAVNDGNQGGALLDDAGRVVGLVSLGTARERRLGTAVPIALVIKDLDLNLPLAPPAAQADAIGATLARAAAQVAPAVAMVYFERPEGIGNPEAVPRPNRLPAQAPAHERERLQNWWDSYYHQQQMFYTDQAVSALVIDAAAGLLLTAASNLHGSAEHGEVLVPGGMSIPCTVAARHLPLDLALLKAERALPFPALTLAPSPQLVVGEPVGVAARHRSDGGFTMTAGVVSATTRHRQQNDFTFAQTDAHANYGSLGGAVIDAAGAVVGMMVMLGPDDERWPWAINSGVALFADSATILRVLPELEQGTSTQRAPVVGLGVGIAPLPDGRLAIVRIEPGTGAADAKLQKDDVILSVDGIEIFGHLAMSRILVRHHEGDTLTVVVRRGGEPKTFMVVLKPFPARPE